MIKKCIICETENNLYSYTSNRNKNPYICNICVKCFDNYMIKYPLNKSRNGIDNESRKKLRARNLGLKQSQETINKRIPYLSVPCTDSRREKIRKSNTGKILSEERKKK